MAWKNVFFTSADHQQQLFFDHILTDGYAPFLYEINNDYD